MEKNPVPELLAPVGSWETFKAALASGADAVYLSGKKFGARYYAENFKESEIKNIIEYAHINGLRVYITVNILIKDSEILEVLDYLLWLYQIGADGIIIQDVGLASLIREVIPNLKLHASTQMTIHNLEGVRWANEFGFKRIILARETELAELKHIISNIKYNEMELEIFAHGALCYAYSGLCMLSSAIGGRSGNRGRCAQPCRKTYHLSYGKKDSFGRPQELKNTSIEDNYLLSTRDLCLYPELDEIAVLPLSSLKIEGRMRSPAYVATVISVYRNALDSIKQNKWTYNQKDMNKLKVVFNRGFTTGYLLEKNPENIMGREYPGNRGLYVGKVERYDEISRIATIKIRRDIKLEKGDGIAIIPPKSSHIPSWGFIIDQNPIIKKGKLFIKIKKPVAPGFKIYKNKEISYAHRIDNPDENLYFKKIPLDICVSWDDHHHPLIDGKISINNKVYNISYKSEYKMEEAVNNPLSKDRIANQLLKTGNTPFEIVNIKIDYPGDLFAPISQLNSLRRGFLEKVRKTILDSYRPTPSDVKESKIRLSSYKKNLNVFEPNLAEHTPYIGIYTSDLPGLQCAIKHGVDRVYFEPNIREANLKSFSCSNKELYAALEEILLKAFEICENVDVDLIWKWPSITNRDFHEYYPSILNKLYEFGLEEVMINNLGDLWGLNHSPLPLKLSGSAGLNIFNHLTLQYFSNYLHSITLSPELSFEEILNLLNFNKSGMPHSELVVQGNLEVLVTKNCLLESCQADYRRHPDEFWGLIDNKNRVFPINMDYLGFTHISNSVELSLIDYTHLLARAGLNGFIIDARYKPVKYLKKIVKIYLEAQKYLEESRGDIEESLEKLKLKIKRIALGGITTGNFIKGLKED